MAAVLLLPGCSLQEFDRAVARMNQQMKARQLARGQRGQSTPRRCQAVDGVRTLSGVDIDSAYVRLKRFFQYKTLDEHTPYDREWIPYIGVRHEALPGVRYAMAQSVQWPSYPGVRVWLVLNLERAGRGVRIHWHHCAGADGWERLPPLADQTLARDIVRIAGGDS